MKKKIIIFIDYMLKQQSETMKQGEREGKKIEGESNTNNKKKRFESC